MHSGFVILLMCMTDVRIFLIAIANIQPIIFYDKNLVLTETNVGILFGNDYIIIFN